MIPTYNRPDLLQKTLMSVLAQVDINDNFQIEVIDNFSDENLAIAALVYSIGKKRVSYYRQPSSVPFQRNWNTCIERAKGKWVHILHDDDIVLPGFYREYGKFLSTHPSVGLVFSRPSLINEQDVEVGRSPISDLQTHDGVINDILPILIRNNIICSTSVVVPKAVYNHLNGFSETLEHTVDWEEWIRISLCYPVGYIRVQRPLMAYRIRTHGLAGDTVKIERIDKKYRDCLYIFETFSSNLPDNKKQICSRAFRKMLLDDSLTQLKLTIKFKKILPAMLHFKWCLKFIYLWMLS
jgi:Glycosyltransferases involved in cell wall biogenesis